MLKKFFGMCLSLFSALAEGFGDENGWDDDDQPWNEKQKHNQIGVYTNLDFFYIIIKRLQMTQEKEVKQPKTKEPDLFGSWEELREKWARAQRGLV